MWKTIPRFNGFYEINKSGKVRKTEPKRLLKPFKNYGYLKFGINKKSWSAHRLVVETFIGPIPPKYHVNHKNKIRHDNRLSNLEICTPRHNVLHRLGLTDKRIKFNVSHAEASKILGITPLTLVVISQGGYLRCKKNKISNCNGMFSYRKPDLFKIKKIIERLKKPVRSYAFCFKRLGIKPAWKGTGIFNNQPYSKAEIKCLKMFRMDPLILKE